MTKPRRTAKPTGSAADFIPPRPTLHALRAAAERCRGCQLYKLATQTVFGEGPATARILVVGEQPGDAEDSQGRPFVGPSGKLLDRALGAAGIDRHDVYVTNAVKHFKWARDARTTRRIHQSPNAAEIRATVHPSAVLRAPRADRDLAERRFIADVRKVGRHLSRLRASPRASRSPRYTGVRADAAGRA